MDKKNHYTMPAEWAEQEMVQLTWPHEGTDWRATLDDITRVYVEMAVEIARREPLLIVAPQPEKALAEIRKSTKATAAVMDNITTFRCDTNDTWARDHGFISLTRKDDSGVQGGDGVHDNHGDGSEKSNRRLCDFRFNGWGEKFEAALDNAINRKLYDAGLVSGDYADENDFVLEGGSIESDGRGTVFTTAPCLLAPHRNQPMDRRAIEQRLKTTLGADRIVWIEHGQLDGDDTDGHIDTLVRTAPGDTLLYVQADETDSEASAAQTAELKAMERELQALRTADGRPFRLIALPSPRTIRDADGETLPATYANFLVINGAVLYPTYNQPDRDEAARKAIARAFDDREMVAIDCRAVIVQHGSLHCCTMQYPRG